MANKPAYAKPGPTYVKRTWAKPTPTKVPIQGTPKGKSAGKKMGRNY